MDAVLQSMPRQQPSGAQAAGGAVQGSAVAAQQLRVIGSLIRWNPRRVFQSGQPAAQRARECYLRCLSLRCDVSIIVDALDLAPQVPPPGFHVSRNGLAILGA